MIPIWNTVRYIDCMDPNKGLPSLPDKCVDIGFTDPPFNVEFKGKEGYHGKRKSKYYSDSNRDYKEWCQSWYVELSRVCKLVFIHIGKIHLSMWYDIDPPYDIVCWIPSNAQPSPGKASWLANMHPILCYGKFGNRRLSQDVYTNPMKIINGLTHPCPLNITFMKKLFSQIKAESVIDPFMGSGSTAHACADLNIKWFGFELDVSYKSDLQKRLRMAKPQVSMNRFFKTR